ncbi:MAG: hypothetical protein ACYDBB_15785 [Armatimonadota bacterium]
MLWAKPSLDPSELLAKSDAVYYYPPVQGVTDLAVDLVIKELQDHPVLKDARITYYFAGERRQQFIVDNIPAGQDRLKKDVYDVVLPLGELLMPRTSAATFAGLKLRAEQVSRQLMGVPSTTFYQLIGVNPDQKAYMKELRVLVDENGIAHEVENVMQDGAVMMARLHNTRIGDKWHLTKMSTRIPTKTDVDYKIDTVQYETFDGFSLPTLVTTQYRDRMNQPIKGTSDMTIVLQNYRINKGVAAAKLPPAPAPETTPPVQGPTK